MNRQVSAPPSDPTHQDKPQEESGKKLLQDVTLGVSVYILGIVVFVVGLVVGFEKFSHLTPHADRALNGLLWIITLSCGTIPGLGTTIIFLGVYLLLRRVLQQSPHGRGIAQGIAMLVALVLAFLASVLITYYFITIVVDSL